MHSELNKLKRTKVPLILFEVQHFLRPFLVKIKAAQFDEILLLYI